MHENVAIYFTHILNEVSNDVEHGWTSECKCKFHMKCLRERCLVCDLDFGWPHFIPWRNYHHLCAPNLSYSHKELIYSAKIIEKMYFCCWYLISSLHLTLVRLYAEAHKVIICSVALFSILFFPLRITTGVSEWMDLTNWMGLQICMHLCSNGKVFFVRIWFSVGFLFVWIFRIRSRFMELMLSSHSHWMHLK